MPELVDKLVSCLTNTYDTLNLKRKEVSREILKKGRNYSFSERKTYWDEVDKKKNVSSLSTVYNTEKKQIQIRSETKQKPNVVMDYNNNMGEIDHMDQNLKHFEIIKKRGRKNFQKDFFPHF